MDYFFSNIEWLLLSEFLGVVNLVLGFGALFLVIGFGRSVHKKAVANDGNYGETIWDHRWRAVFTLIIVLLIAGFINGSYLYRPKNVVEAPVTESHEKRMHDEKMRARPEFRTPEKAPTWEEEVEKNRKENEAAKERFDKLPDAKE